MSPGNYLKASSIPKPRHCQCHSTLSRHDRRRN